MAELKYNADKLVVFLRRREMGRIFLGGEAKFTVCIKLSLSYLGSCLRSDLERNPCIVYVVSACGSSFCWLNGRQILFQ